MTPFNARQIIGTHVSHMTEGGGAVIGQKIDYAIDHEIDHEIDHRKSIRKSIFNVRTQHANFVANGVPYNDTGL